MRERLHVDAKGWRGTGEDMTMLAVVQDALARERKLAFDYTRADGQKAPRTVDPLGLVAKGLSWYLVANAANGLPDYKFRRIEAAPRWPWDSNGLGVLTSWLIGSSPLRNWRSR